MLKNDYSITFYRHDVVEISLEYRDTRRIIIRCAGLVAALVREALGQVEAETVDIIFLEKIAKTLLDMLADDLVVMIDIMEYAERIIL